MESCCSCMHGCGMLCCQLCGATFAAHMHGFHHAPIYRIWLCLTYYLWSHVISHSLLLIVQWRGFGQPCTDVRNGSIIVPAAIMPACHLHAWYLLTSPVFCDTHAWRIAANEGPAPVLQAATVSACCQCAPPAAARCRDASFMFARA
jgi:hypothetical protein